MKVAAVAAGVSAVTSGSFVDSGSVDLRGSGTYLVEVRDAGQTIGGALVVLGAGWAAVLASASVPTGLTPTFSVVGAAVRVATAGATARTVSVAFRAVCGSGDSVDALPG
jgi:hypothetical protein